MLPDDLLPVNDDDLEYVLCTLGLKAITKSRIQTVTTHSLIPGQPRYASSLNTQQPIIAAAPVE